MHTVCIWVSRCAAMASMWPQQGWAQACGAAAAVCECNLLFVVQNSPQGASEGCEPVHTKFLLCGLCKPAKGQFRSPASEHPTSRENISDTVVTRYTRKLTQTPTRALCCVAEVLTSMSVQVKALRKVRKAAIDSSCCGMSGWCEELHTAKSRGKQLI